MSVHKLKNVLSSMKSTFIGKDEIIDLLGITLVARENAFLLGPPGTAKSAIVRALASSITNGKSFDYLLTRFTEPNELFGPFDIKKLKEGELSTNTSGMMPEASLVFLDEIFNANSAILNSLLMALNERVFRRGKENILLPTLMFVGASNQLPEEENLAALLDRFLIRLKCDYVPSELLQDVLVAGWKLQNNTIEDKPTIDVNEILSLQEECKGVSLNSVLSDFVQLIFSLRNAGVSVSDRRAVKYQNLLAASAVINGRSEVNVSDFWILKHTWDTEEQIEIIAGLINTISEKKGVITNSSSQSNAENLMRDVKNMLDEFETTSPSAEAQNMMKDKLRYIQNQVKWLSNDNHRIEIEKLIDSLWNKMLQKM